MCQASHAAKFIVSPTGVVGDGFQAVDREARREERAQIAAHRWLKLNKLRIISEVDVVSIARCQHIYLSQVGEWLVVRLVTACPNLTNLSLGMHTSITDSGLRKILASNRWLSRLAFMTPAAFKYLTDFPAVLFQSWNKRNSKLRKVQ